MLKQISCYLISLLFIVGGVMHFTHDSDLAAITPLPFAYQIVWVTGVMELFFALFILLPAYRQLTGLYLSVFCLLVLPANMYMAIYQLPMFGEMVDPLILWLRLPGQFGLIAWIFYATDSFSLVKKQGFKGFLPARASH
jgi:uncharacterized membrane protein